MSAIVLMVIGYGSATLAVLALALLVLLAKRGNA